jgi:uncharacterized protein (DUF1330 family)
MKAKYGVALAIGSFALGAAAVQTLHAQAKPPAYVVAEIDVKDQDGYKTDFLPKAQANIKEQGGKYLAGGYNKSLVGSGNPPPNRVVLLQFENMDAAKGFFDKEAKIEKDVGSKYVNSFRTFAIEGPTP